MKLKVTSVFHLEFRVLQHKGNTVRSDTEKVSFLTVLHHWAMHWIGQWFSMGRPRCGSGLCRLWGKYVMWQKLTSVARKRGIKVFKLFFTDGNFAKRADAKEGWWANSLRAKGIYTTAVLLICMPFSLMSHNNKPPASHSGAIPVSPKQSRPIGLPCGALAEKPLACVTCLAAAMWQSALCVKQIYHINDKTTGFPVDYCNLTRWPIRFV